MISSEKTNTTRTGLCDRVDARSGHTLLEMVGVMAVLLVLLVALGGTMSSSQAAFVEVLGSTTTDDAARRAMDRMLSEIRLAQRSSLVLAQLTGARAVAFATTTGWDGSAPVRGPEQKIYFASGKIVMNGYVIAEGIKDLTFSLRGTVLTVAIDAERQIWVKGVARTVSRQLLAELYL